MHKHYHRIGILVLGAYLAVMAGYLLSSGCSRGGNPPTPVPTSSSTTSTSMTTSTSHSTSTTTSTTTTSRATTSRTTTSTTTTTLDPAWYPVNSGTGVDLFAVYFTDNQHGFVGGANGVVNRTTDEGASWRGVGIAGLSTQPIASISFSDSNHGCIVAYAGATPLIFQTVDGGDHWVAVPNTGISGNPTNSCLATGESHIWLPQQDRFYEYDGNGWTDRIADVVQLNTASQIKMWGSPGTGYSYGYIVGMANDVPGGLIYYTKDGGANWGRATVPSTIEQLSFNFRSVAMTGQTTAVAVGDNSSNLDQICRTSDGSFWTLVLSAEGGYFNAVGFADASSGWVMGSIGDFFYQTSDGGATWGQVASPVHLNGHSIHAIQFPTATRGFAVGDGGIILKCIH